MKLNHVPPPQILFRQFERGEISREELQASCALHQREMLAEIQEMKLNPAAAYIEEIRIKREANRIRREHGEGIARDVLEALAEVPDFSPAILLWNAGNRAVPFHCFFRLWREPVFREQFTLYRGAEQELVVAGRKVLS